MKELKYWRDRIDEIDAGILRLLSRRARLAIELGKLKRTYRLPYRVPRRERAVLERHRRSKLVGRVVAGARLIVRLRRKFSPAAVYPRELALFKPAGA